VRDSDGSWCRDKVWPLAGGQAWDRGLQHPRGWIRHEGTKGRRLATSRRSRATTTLPTRAATMLSSRGHQRGDTNLGQSAAAHPMAPVSMDQETPMVRKYYDGLRHSTRQGRGCRVSPTRALGARVRAGLLWQLGKLKPMVLVPTHGTASKALYTSVSHRTPSLSHESGMHRGCICGSALHTAFYTRGAPGVHLITALHTALPSGGIRGCTYGSTLHTAFTQQAERLLLQLQGCRHLCRTLPCPGGKGYITLAPRCELRPAS
jgi:hypothetical protein